MSGMKKIITFIILGFIITFTTGQLQCNAGIISNYKTRTEAKRLDKATLNEIRTFIQKQDDIANKKDLDALLKMYSDSFLNSDGFNKKSYTELIKETWETYPDITYKTEIKNIEYTDNYATVIVTETAVATTKELIGQYETIGELLSKTRCVYHLEKQGKNWLIGSESIIEENTSLKFGDARYVDMKLYAPKQTGTNTDYTVTLKVYAPADSTVVGSITREKIVYPQEKSEEAFRRVYDNTLERVFKSNSDNVNEYAVGTVGITHAENYDAERVRVYLSGMAFIMTRVNVIPENKFINFEDKKTKHE